MGSKNSVKRWREVDKGNLPLPRVVRDFAFSKRSENWSDKTVRWYAHTLKLFMRWLEQKDHSMRLGDLDSSLSREYIVYLQTKPRWEANPYVPTQSKHLSPESVHTHVRALRAFFHWLETEGYLEEHLIKSIQVKRPQPTIPEILTQDVFQHICNALDVGTARGARGWALLTILADAGQRASEVLGLQLNDLHLLPKGSWVKVRGKGGKERIVPLGTKSQRALARYVETFRPESLNADNHAFLTEDGRPLNYDGLKSWMHRRSKWVGLHLHPHLLRHTYATNYLLNDCGDVFTLQDNLGHTSLEMSRRYAHLARRHSEIQKRRPSSMDRMSISRSRKPLQS